MMNLKELQEILKLEGISEETREAVAEIVGSQSQVELDGDKEKAIREILEVELNIQDLQAELAEKTIAALDKFTEEGNAAAVEEMREQSRQMENRVDQQFREL